MTPKKIALLPDAEVVAIADLKPHERNYRAHPPDQVAHIAQSLREHGFYRPVVIAKDGTILAGHGLIEAAKQVGVNEVPVVRLRIGPDDPRALKILAGDNEMSLLAEIDDRALSNLLKEINEVDDLLGTGFDEQTLAALAFVTRPREEIADFDAAAEWAGVPSYDAGSPEYSLVIRFLSEEVRSQFIEASVITKIDRTNANGRVMSTWYPTREQDDLISLSWKEQEE